jgi:Flp pilus assembly protein TadG
MRKDEAGAVAVVFAVSLIPLIGFAGFALDYARASLGRAQLQAAVDSAGLAVAHLPRNTSVTVLQQKASDWVNTNLAGKGLGPVTVIAEKVGTSIRFTASTTVGLSLFRILRKEPIAVSAGNEISWDLGKVEIALVLDNTGSMVNGGSPKLQNLKTAATSLANQLEDAAAKPEQVKVAVVPFSMTVNVGSQYSTASWIDKDGKSPVNKQIFYNSNPSRFDLFGKLNLAWGGCIEGRESPHDVQESPPNEADPATLYVPFFAPDEPGNKSSSSYYNDYLDDLKQSGTPWKERQGNVEKYNLQKYGTTRRTGTSGIGYKFGPNAGCALQPLLRLTQDMAAVRQKIDDMTAVGDTNIAMGLVWGWHVLSPNAPFGDGVAYNTPDLTKFVIQNLVAGNNNGSIYSGLGYIWQGRLGITSGDADARENAMDSRLRTLCTNVKATGIQIFTVRVEVTSGRSDLLEKCATSPDMFSNVANSTDLASVFSRIGDKITQLRLSK